jgi:hypothetical protein
MVNVVVQVAYVHVHVRFVRAPRLAVMAVHSCLLHRGMLNQLPVYSSMPALLLLPLLVDVHVCVDVYMCVYRM